MQLSGRLKCAADYVTKGYITADIGCDHAYTSIYLAKNGICPFVYAADINDGPLERALNNIKLYQQEDKIFVVKSNGLKEFDHTTPLDCILICGMGGNLITDILQDIYVTNHMIKELVLSPQSDIFRVRHFLHDNGYRIEDESMIYDDGKYYTIIKAVLGKEQYDNEFEYVYGRALIIKKDIILLKYLRNQLAKCNTLHEKLNNTCIADTSMKRIIELKKDIKMIENCIMAMS